MTAEHRPLEASRTSLEESDSDSDLLHTAALQPASLDETSPLPAPNGSAPGDRSVLMRLYVSHTLSAWNSRMFEFGAVLFLASIFPGTLLYASIYALVRSLAAVALSSWLGAKVDSSDRLVALRHSIGKLIIVLSLGDAWASWLTAIPNSVWQRIPVAASCLCFMALFKFSGSLGISSILFVVVGFLACVEKLAASANTVAVERDWVCRGDALCHFLMNILLMLLISFRLSLYRRALMFPDRVSYPRLLLAVGSSNTGDCRIECFNEKN